MPVNPFINKTWIDVVRRLMICDGEDNHRLAQGKAITDVRYCGRYLTRPVAYRDYR